MQPSLDPRQARLVERLGPWLREELQGQVLCGWWHIWWKCAATVGSGRGETITGLSLDNQPDWSSVLIRSGLKEGRPFGVNTGGWTVLCVGWRRVEKWQRNTALSGARQHQNWRHLSLGLEGKGLFTMLASYTDSHGASQVLCPRWRGPLWATESHVFSSQKTFLFSLSLLPSERKRKESFSFPKD